MQAILSIGWGDYPAEDFEKAFEGTWVDGDREREILYMVGKLSTADYFAQGFEKLKRARMV